MKSLTPRTLDWIDQAPVRVSVRHHLRADADAVWKRIADHASWTEWMQTLDSIEPGPVSEGIGGTRRVSFGPFVVDEEFIAWEPARRFAFTGTGINRKVLRSLAEEVLLEEVDGGGTAVTYTMALDPLAARVLRVVLKPGLTKNLRAALERLDELTA